MSTRRRRPVTASITVAAALTTALLTPAARGAGKDAGSPARPFGAYHLRLIDLRERVLAGDSVPIELSFRTEEPVTVDVLVEPSDAGWREPQPLCR